jgi:hypothetical protein
MWIDTGFEVDDRDAKRISTAAQQAATFYATNSNPSVNATTVALRYAEAEPQ